METDYPLSLKRLRSLRDSFAVPGCTRDDVLASRVKSRAIVVFLIVLFYIFFTASQIYLSHFNVFYEKSEILTWSNSSGTTNATSTKTNESGKNKSEKIDSTKSESEPDLCEALENGSGTQLSWSGEILEPEKSLGSVVVVESVIGI
jgi:hypothetical protein